MSALFEVAILKLTDGLLDIKSKQDYSIVEAAICLLSAAGRVKIALTKKGDYVFEHWEYQEGITAEEMKRGREANQALLRVIHEAQNGGTGGEDGRNI